MSSGSPGDISMKTGDKTSTRKHDDLSISCNESDNEGISFMNNGSMTNFCVGDSDSSDNITSPAIEEYKRKVRLSKLKQRTEDRLLGFPALFAAKEVKKPKRFRQPKDNGKKKVIQNFGLVDCSKKESAHEMSTQVAKEVEPPSPAIKEDSSKPPRVKSSELVTNYATFLGGKPKTNDVLGFPSLSSVKSRDVKAPRRLTVEQRKEQSKRKVLLQTFDLAQPTCKREDLPEVTSRSVRVVNVKEALEGRGFSSLDHTQTSANNTLVEMAKSQAIYCSDLENRDHSPVVNVKEASEGRRFSSLDHTPTSANNTLVEMAKSQAIYCNDLENRDHTPVVNVKEAPEGRRFSSLDHTPTSASNTLVEMAKSQTIYCSDLENRDHTPVVNVKEAPEGRRFSSLDHTPTSASNTLVEMAKSQTIYCSDLENRDHSPSPIERVEQETSGDNQTSSTPALQPGHCHQLEAENRLAQKTPQDVQSIPKEMWKPVFCQDLEAEYNLPKAIPPVDSHEKPAEVSVFAKVIPVGVQEPQQQPLIHQQVDPQPVVKQNLVFTEDLQQPPIVTATVDPEMRRQMGEQTALLEQRKKELDHLKREQKRRKDVLKRQKKVEEKVAKQQEALYEKNAEAEAQLAAVVAVKEQMEEVERVERENKELATKIRRQKMEQKSRQKHQKTLKERMKAQLAFRTKLYQKELKLLKQQYSFMKESFKNDHESKLKAIESEEGDAARKNQHNQECEKYRKKMQALEKKYSTKVESIEAKRLKQERKAYLERLKKQHKTQGKIIKKAKKVERKRFGWGMKLEIVEVKSRLEEAKMKSDISVKELKLQETDNGLVKLGRKEKKARKLLKKLKKGEMSTILKIRKAGLKKRRKIEKARNKKEIEKLKDEEDLKVKMKAVEDKERAKQLADALAQLESLKKEDKENKKLIEERIKANIKELEEDEQLRMTREKVSEDREKLLAAQNETMEQKRIEEEGLKEKVLKGLHDKRQKEKDKEIEKLEKEEAKRNKDLMKQLIKEGKVAKEKSAKERKQKIEELKKDLAQKREAEKVHETKMKLIEKKEKDVSENKTNEALSKAREKGEMKKLKQEQKRRKEETLKTETDLKRLERKEVKELSLKLDKLREEGVLKDSQVDTEAKFKLQKLKRENMKEKRMAKIKLEELKLKEDRKVASTVKRNQLTKKEILVSKELELVKNRAEVKELQIQEHANKRELRTQMLQKKQLEYHAKQKDALNLFNIRKAEDIKKNLHNVDKKQETNVSKMKDQDQSTPSKNTKLNRIEEEHKKIIDSNKRRVSIERSTVEASQKKDAEDAVITKNKQLVPKPPTNRPAATQMRFKRASGVHKSPSDTCSEVDESSFCTVSDEEVFSAASFESLEGDDPSFEPTNTKENEKKTSPEDRIPSAVNKSTVIKKDVIQKKLYRHHLNKNATNQKKEHRNGSMVKKQTLKAVETNYLNDHDTVSIVKQHPVKTVKTNHIKERGDILTGKKEEIKAVDQTIASYNHPKKKIRRNVIAISPPPVRKPKRIVETKGETCHVPKETKKQVKTVTFKRETKTRHLEVHQESNDRVKARTKKEVTNADFFDKYQSGEPTTQYIKWCKIKNKLLKQNSALIAELEAETSKRKCAEEMAHKKEEQYEKLRGDCIKREAELEANMLRIQNEKRRILIEYATRQSHSTHKEPVDRLVNLEFRLLEKEKLIINSEILNRKERRVNVLLESARKKCQEMEKLISTNENVKKRLDMRVAALRKLVSDSLIEERQFSCTENTQSTLPMDNAHNINANPSPDMQGRFLEKALDLINKVVPSHSEQENTFIKSLDVISKLIDTRPTTEARKSTVNLDTSSTESTENQPDECVNEIPIMESNTVPKTNQTEDPSKTDDLPVTINAAEITPTKDLSKEKIREEVVRGKDDIAAHKDHKPLLLNNAEKEKEEEVRKENDDSKDMYPQEDACENVDDTAAHKDLSCEPLLPNEDRKECTENRKVTKVNPKEHHCEERKMDLNAQDEEPSEVNQKIHNCFSKCCPRQDSETSIAQENVEMNTSIDEAIEEKNEDFKESIQGGSQIVEEFKVVTEDGKSNDENDRVTDPFAEWDCLKEDEPNSIIEEKSAEESLTASIATRAEDTTIVTEDVKDEGDLDSIIDEILTIDTPVPVVKQIEDNKLEEVKVESKDINNKKDDLDSIIDEILLDGSLKETKVGNEVSTMKKGGEDISTKAKKKVPIWLQSAPPSVSTPEVDVGILDETKRKPVTKGRRSTLLQTLPRKYPFPGLF